MLRSYGQYGIRTIPLDSKKPMVKWANLQLEDCVWGSEWDSADTGVICGDVVTIIDVDNPHHEERAVELFGETPLKSRTPKGLHLWYCASGERRMIRPISGLDLDILGEGGYAVAPDSKGYNFVSGDLTDIPNLPPLADLPATVYTKKQNNFTAVGERNTALFNAGRRLALGIETVEELVLRLKEVSAKFEGPLDDAEVHKVAGSIWAYKEAGRLITSSHPGFVVRNSEHDELMYYPNAYVLLADLRRNHGARNKDFALANAVRRRYGWSLPTFHKARRVLEKLGYVEITQRGGRRLGDTRRVRLAYPLGGAPVAGTVNRTGAP
jgi:hypothetical protein